MFNGKNKKNIIKRKKNMEDCERKINEIYEWVNSHSDLTTKFDTLTDKINHFETAIPQGISSDLSSLTSAIEKISDDLSIFTLSIEEKINALEKTPENFTTVFDKHKLLMDDIKKIKLDIKFIHESLGEKGGETLFTGMSLIKAEIKKVSEISDLKNMLNKLFTFIGIPK